MSRVVKQKHIMKEMLTDDYELPKDDQQIVRVVSSKGNNLHEVEPATEETKFLVSMPNKFRKNLWVKRGDFLIVDPIEEGDKVKAEISRILTSEHVKEFTKQGVWPKKFTKKRERQEEEEVESDEFFQRNLNRHHLNKLECYDDDDSNSADSEDE